MTGGVFVCVAQSVTVDLRLLRDEIQVETVKMEIAKFNRNHFSGVVLLCVLRFTSSASSTRLSGG